MDVARAEAPDPGTQSPPSSTALGEPELSSLERDILEFERQWWRVAGAKEQAIRDRFDLSSTRYHQLLNTLLDSPAALRTDPMLVKRLQRLRSSRERSRSDRRLGREA